MRSYRSLSGTILLAVSLAGCAALLRGDPRPGPEQIAERGLAALERGDYDGGLSDLRWVATYHPERPVARYALLVVAATELDPANPDRAAEGGARRLAELRGLPDNPIWIPPIAASLDRVFLELGETRERLEQAERSARRASSRAARSRADAEEARAGESALRARVAELERQLERSRVELAAARTEVARMRRALGG